VSIINKMLQELDRRHASARPQGQARHPDVRAVATARSGHEWFWRAVAALMLVAAMWTLWVVYQLQPRSVATELAHRAAENARRRTPAAPAPAAEPPAVVAQAAAALPTTVDNQIAPSAGAPSTTPGVLAPGVPAPGAPASVPKPTPEALVAPIETLRLALTIDTPLAPRSRAAAKSTAASTAPAPVARALPARSAQPAGPGPARVEKRDRTQAPVERAEAAYRRAAALLNSGRIADAEEALLAAHDADPTHQAARQTLIALYLEQRRIEGARQHLQEGLGASPSFTPFAVALARIHFDRREYAAALGVLDQTKASGEGIEDFHALRGAVLQRLSRHGEAADAYRLSLATGMRRGASWVGLGMSLEALDRRPEAAEAFRRGIATGTLAGELLTYAEQREQQLR
jgi:MSHA biogenesis protein MshN